MSPNQITERQLALAVCLGLEIRPDTTSQELGEQIDRRKSRTNGGPPNNIQVQLAKSWNLDVDEDTTSHDLGWALWHKYDDDPQLDVPENVQMLIFGQSLEDSGSSQSGCLAGIVTAFMLAATILLMFQYSLFVKLP